MPIRWSHRSVGVCASVTRWLVMCTKCPTSCHAVTVSTAPGYGTAARIDSGAVRLGDARVQLLGTKP